MKRLLILMLAATLLLTGCNKNTAGSSETPQKPSSSQEESIAEENEPPTEDPLESKEASIVEDNAFYQDVLLTYGAKLDEAGVLHPHMISLFYNDGWQTAGELSPGSFFSWRLSQIGREDIAHEEMFEKYASPLGPDNGWFFEQDEYEALVQQFFDVSAEYLRSDPTFYSEELQGYTVQGGGGRGEQPDIELLGVEKENNLRMLRFALRYQYSEDKVSVLTIRMGADGAYKFISCVPADSI